jgi:hypothetical protein
VAEDVFGLSGHGRPSFSADELPPLEGVEPLLDLPAVEVRHVGQRTGPEHPAKDCRLLDQRLLVGVEGV